MLVQTAAQPVLLRATVRYSGSAARRAAHVATAVNALLTFASFVGLLGAGVFLQAADRLLRLGRAEEELLPM